MNTYEKAKLIAQSLGSDWHCMSFDEYHGSEREDRARAFLFNTVEGIGIFIMQEWNNKDKLRIMFTAPKGAPKSNVTVYTPGSWEKWERPVIGVSASKSPERIANDIERRLLKELKEYTAAYIARATQESEYLTECEKVKNFIMENYAKMPKGIRLSDNGQFLRVEFEVPSVQLGLVKDIAEEISANLNR